MYSVYYVFQTGNQTRIRRSTGNPSVRDNTMKRYVYFLRFVCLPVLTVCSIYTTSHASTESASLAEKHWTADNGNGTYSNPLFYEEFEDPDIIRVGEDYYLVGTTMHMNPALQIMHSKDLVNWELIGYCMERLDLGPEFRLEEGKHIYGQGIWAPCIRYHNGMFYIFSNVNGAGLQVFRSESIHGPGSETNCREGMICLFCLTMMARSTLFPVTGIPILSKNCLRTSDPSFRTPGVSWMPPVWEKVITSTRSMAGIMTFQPSPVRLLIRWLPERTPLMVLDG